ncbi:hypothetical protein [Streptomyces sp. NPDC058964]|uniref:hypothetical protein n=1 Tax=Streptomyces sp. NPDC058964 TaxID=3346681 RepID=UPI0036B3F14E
MSKEFTAYEERYLALMDELESGAGVRVLAEERGPVVTAYGDAETVLAKIARRFDLVLDPSSRSRVLRFRKLACQWEISGPGPTLAGEFGLKNLYTSITTGPLEIAQDFSSAADRRLAAELRLLDDQPEGGAGSFTALRMQPGVPLPEIWHFTVAHGFCRLDVGYAEYLDRLLVTKGTYGWQYLFADVSLRDPEFIHVRGRLSAMLSVFPKLFPEHDYSDLRARLEARA